jgi:hypothetical protein
VAYALAAAFDLRWVYLLCAALLALALVTTLFEGGSRHPSGRPSLEDHAWADPP